jgi:hypothetical protein
MYDRTSEDGITKFLERDIAEDIAVDVAGNLEVIATLVASLRLPLSAGRSVIFDHDFVCNQSTCIHVSSRSGLRV